MPCPHKIALAVSALILLAALVLTRKDDAAMTRCEEQYSPAVCFDSLYN